MDRYDKPWFKARFTILYRTGVSINYRYGMYRAVLILYCIGVSISYQYGMYRAVLSIPTHGTLRYRVILNIPVRYCIDQLSIRYVPSCTKRTDTWYTKISSCTKRTVVDKAMKETTSFVALVVALVVASLDPRASRSPSLQLFSLLPAGSRSSREGGVGLGSRKGVETSSLRSS
ncbi:hypothetical protein GW17_00002338 [Ensete ventricosum]|nr:hypothetical protein GW17_00002338 [Ensete ventricosum]